MIGLRGNRDARESRRGTRPRREPSRAKGSMTLLRRLLVAPEHVADPIPESLEPRSNLVHRYAPV
jgi:hypothetical protein